MVSKSVSIPIGFSGLLQLQNNNLINDLKNSFNPYRVFRFVATARANKDVFKRSLVRSEERRVG